MNRTGCGPIEPDILDVLYSQYPAYDVDENRILMRSCVGHLRMADDRYRARHTDPATHATVPPEVYSALIRAGKSDIGWACSQFFCDGLRLIPGEPPFTVLRLPWITEEHLLAAG